MGLLETQAFPEIERNSCLPELSWTCPFLPRHGFSASLPHLQILGLSATLSGSPNLEKGAQFLCTRPPSLLSLIPIIQV